MSKAIKLDRAVLASGKTLLAADVCILDSVTLLGVRLMESNNEEEGSWLALPQRKYANDAGETRYAHIVKLSADCRNGLLRVMRTEYTRLAGEPAQPEEGGCPDPFADE